MFSPIRVLVVDDSALVRQLLTKALSLDPRIEIVGTAKDGVEAIEKTLELAPDVVTLDIEMPELSGLEALPHLAKRSDARVIVLSCIDDPETTYQALSNGAVDFISKPEGGFASSLSDLTDHLVKKIKVAYRIEPEVVRRAQEAVVDYKMSAPPSAVRTSELSKLVVIASSTGGPPALESVFAGLSADLPAAYLLVQHLPAGFGDSLARRLSRVTDIKMVQAVDGMRIDPGHAYIAPHGRHMRVYAVEGSAPRISLDDGPLIHGVRPSADPLMRSAVDEFGPVVGVVLTGMGRDGVQGLDAVRRSGGETIAQDEETSVVWGMPGAAVAAGVVDMVVPLHRISAEVRRAIRGGVASSA